MSIMDASRMIEESDIEKALDYLRDTAEITAKATAERIYMEEYRKSLKAIIMKERSVGINGKESTVSAQERDAYADARYIEHLEGLKTAVFVEQQCRFLREAALAKIEAWRSQCANERAVRL